MTNPERLLEAVEVTAGVLALMGQDPGEHLETERVSLGQGLNQMLQRQLSYVIKTQGKGKKGPW